MMEGQRDSAKNKETEKKKRSRVKQLLADVKKQVEFWFGDVNLHKDRFLRRVMEESEDGYVDISVLTSFNRMKKLTGDARLVARALRNSSVVEVNLEGNKVRRRHPLGEEPKDVDDRTVYVELLPKDVTHGWIERVFSKVGTVVYVSVPRYRTSGDPKGFAFVEFEKEEEAQHAIQMLNNPPEDAPRKAGIFPKTRCGKPVPLPPPAGEEEEKKKRKKKKKKESSKEAKGQPTEAESAAPKRRRSTVEGGASETTPVKAPEKKRRRSQTDESEGDVPAKIRKTRASVEAEKDVTETSSVVQSETEKEGKENGDESALKAKRRRKRRHKERMKVGEEVLPLRVLSKRAWLGLKDEYLQLQKRSMTSLKKHLPRVEACPAGGGAESSGPASSGAPSSVQAGGALSQGPQFTSGVILKITHSRPLPDRKCIKEALSKLSPVAYVDVLEGDTEGHVRFHSPEDARAVSAAAAALQRRLGWRLEVVSGEREQRYWHKILVDRQVKLNRPREKRRGSQKLISKAEKILQARAREANQHIRFQDD